MTRKTTSLGKSTYTLDWDSDDKGFALYTRTNPGSKT